MLGAYGWAYIKPIRKLYYNLTITSVSVVVAFVVGGIEALGLLAGQLHLTAASSAAHRPPQLQLRNPRLSHHRPLRPQLDRLHRHLQMAPLRRPRIRRLNRSHGRLCSTLGKYGTLQRGGSCDSGGFTEMMNKTGPERPSSSHPDIRNCYRFCVNREGWFFEEARLRGTVLQPMQGSILVLLKSCCIPFVPAGGLAT